MDAICNASRSILKLYATFTTVALCSGRYNYWTLHTDAQVCRCTTSCSEKPEQFCRLHQSKTMQSDREITSNASRAVVLDDKGTVEKE